MGGPSGEVGFPLYMSQIHSDLMYGDFDSGAANDPMFGQNMKAIGEAVITGTNPYTGENSYDPDVDLSNFEGSIVAFEGVAGSIDETSQWLDMAETAISILDRIDPQSTEEDTDL